MLHPIRTPGWSSLHTPNSDGTATLTYRMPTAVFAPYQNKALDALAKELDPVIEKIAADAVAK